MAKTERSYNIYLKKLVALAEDESATMRPDKRLLQMLAQIKEQYRNPLVTPENNVSPEQATSLFGLATAIITMMAEQIVSRQKPANGSKARKEAKAALASVADEASSEDDDDEESYSFHTSQAG